MKRLLLVLLLSASACALLDVVKYDPALAAGITTLWNTANALEQNCGTPREAFVTEVLKSSAAWLAEFTFYGAPADKAAAAKMVKIASDLDTALGKMYCVETAKDIKREADRFLQTVNGRPR